jgi:hypothetical protein
MHSLIVFGIYYNGNVLCQNGISKNQDLNNHL